MDESFDQTEDLVDDDFVDDDFDDMNRSAYDNRYDRNKIDIPGHALHYKGDHYKGPKESTINRLANNPAEFKKYMFMNQLAKRYSNMCIAFEALDVYKKGRIRVNDFIVACVNICGLEEDVDVAKTLFHCIKGNKLGKVHLVPEDFGISQVEWDKYQAAKVKQTYAQYKRNQREARKNDLLGMRVTNFKIPPDQVGRLLFPGGLHVQNWRVDPGVKALLHKNRALTEEVNMKNLLLEQVVSKCEELQLQIVSQESSNQKHMNEKLNLAEGLKNSTLEMERRMAHEREKLGLLEAKEIQRQQRKDEYKNSPKGKILNQIVECCERNNQLLESHKHFMTSVYSKLKSVHVDGELALDDPAGDGSSPNLYYKEGAEGGIADEENEQDNVAGFSANGIDSSGHHSGVGDLMMQSVTTVKESNSLLESQKESMLTSSNVSFAAGRTKTRSPTTTSDPLKGMVSKGAFLKGAGKKRPNSTSSVSSSMQNSSPAKSRAANSNSVQGKQNTSSSGKEFSNVSCSGQTAFSSGEKHTLSSSGKQERKGIEIAFSRDATSEPRSQTSSGISDGTSMMHIPIAIPEDEELGTLGTALPAPLYYDDSYKVDDDSFLNMNALTDSKISIKASSGVTPASSSASCNSSIPAANNSSSPTGKSAPLFRNAKANSSSSSASSSGTANVSNSNYSKSVNQKSSQQGSSSSFASQQVSNSASQQGSSSASQHGSSSSSQQSMGSMNLKGSGSSGTPKNRFVPGSRLAAKINNGVIDEKQFIDEKALQYRKQTASILEAAQAGGRSSKKFEGQRAAYASHNATRASPVKGGQRDSASELIQTRLNVTSDASLKHSRESGRVVAKDMKGPLNHGKGAYLGPPPSTIGMKNEDLEDVWRNFRNNLRDSNLKAQK